MFTPFPFHACTFLVIALFLTLQLARNVILPSVGEVRGMQPRWEYTVVLLWSDYSPNGELSAKRTYPPTKGGAALVVLVA